MEPSSMFGMLSGLLAVGIGMILIVMFLGLIIMVVSLYLGGKIVKTFNDEFIYAIKTVFYWFLAGIGLGVINFALTFISQSSESVQIQYIAGIIGLLAVIAYIVAIIIIVKKVYDVGVLKAILLLLIAGVINGLLWGGIIAVFGGMLFGTFKDKISLPFVPSTAIVEEENGELTSGQASQEVHFGADRNEFLANGEKFKVGTQTFIESGAVFNDQVDLAGVWDIQSEYAENKSPNAIINYRYKANDVYMLLSAKKPVKVKINQNARYLSENAGEDVDENSYVTVYEERLYHIVHNDDASRYNKVELIVENTGLKAFYFKTTSEDELIKEPEREVTTTQPKLPSQPEPAKTTTEEMSEAIEKAMQDPDANARARDTSRIADLLEIAQALNMYYMENGSYPPSAGNFCLKPGTKPADSIAKYIRGGEITVPKITEGHYALGCKDSYFYKSLIYKGLLNDSYVIAVDMETWQMANFELRAPDNYAKFTTHENVITETGELSQESSDPRMSVYVVTP
jgi:hypothetical protein